MNRIEFMGQLERLLSDIPGDERAEALEYYNSYFDDAGEENEAEVIEKLGSPGKVAAVIKADLNSSEYDDSEDYANYTDTGYEDERFEDRRVPQGRRRNGYQAKRENGRGRAALLIILAIFTFPLWGAIGTAVLGGALGILLGVIGIVFGAFVAGVAMTVGGIALSVIGITNMASLGIGLALLGSGMIILALGILLLLAFGWFAFGAGPKLFRWLTDRLHRILHRGKGETV